MEDRQYSVRDTSGKYSPSTPEKQVIDYIWKGFIKPQTIVRDCQSGQEMTAGKHPILASVFRQMGVAAPAAEPQEPPRLSSNYPPVTQNTTIPLPTKQALPKWLISVIAIVGFCLFCGLISPLLPDTPTKADAWGISKDFVTTGLKAPATAQFPGFSSDFVEPLSETNFQVTSYVDSQNSFGALIRSEWTVRIHYEGKQQWTLRYCKIGDDVLKIGTGSEGSAQDKHQPKLIDELPTGFPMP